MGGPSPLGALRIYDRGAWLELVRGFLSKATRMSAEGCPVGSAQVADLLGVSPRTLYRWIQETPELAQWHNETPSWHKERKK